jgi:hypothetical protein
MSGEVDEGSSCTGGRDPVDLRPIDQRHRHDGMNSMVVPMDLTVAADRHVEGCVESIPIEAVKRGGRVSTGERIATDVEDQRSKPRSWRLLRSAETEDVRAWLMEEAALYSATKLLIGQTDGVRLLSRERTQLTSCLLHQTVIHRGHGPESSARVSQSQLPHSARPSPSGAPGFPRAQTGKSPRCARGNGRGRAVRVVMSARRQRRTRWFPRAQMGESPGCARGNY